MALAKELELQILEILFKSTLDLKQSFFKMTMRSQAKVAMTQLPLDLNPPFDYGAPFQFPTCCFINYLNISNLLK
jgi:hypothetical protein